MLKYSSSFLFIIKFYLQKFNHFYFFKVKNEYKQNGNIIPVDNVIILFC